MSYFTEENNEKEFPQANDPVKESTEDTETAIASTDPLEESEQSEEECIAEAEATSDCEKDSQDEELEEPGTGIKALSFAFDLTELFAISFAVVIVFLCFFLRHSPVSGSSMEPTIQNLDTLLVSNIAYTPAYGDIVIVQSTHNLAKPLVKRIIAVGGDQIEINFSRWLIKVNGTVIEQRYDADGNYVKIGGDYVNFVEGEGMRLGSVDGSDLYKIGFTYDAATGNYVATVPEGRLFILGDNRNDSKDSRDASVGFVDERLVVGKAIFRLTPFSNIGTLD